MRVSIVQNKTVVSLNFQGAQIIGLVSLAGFNVDAQDRVNFVTNALQSERLTLRIVAVTIDYSSVKDTLAALGVDSS